MVEETPTVEERVQELEVRAAFAERTTQDLDEVVREFAGRVQRLELQLKDLREQLSARLAEPSQGE